MNKNVFSIKLLNTLLKRTSICIYIYIFPCTALLGKRTRRETVAGAPLCLLTAGN